MKVTKRLIEQWRMAFVLYCTRPNDHNRANKADELILVLGHALNEIERLRKELRMKNKK